MSVRNPFVSSWEVWASWHPFEARKAHNLLSGISEKPSTCRRMNQVNTILIRLAQLLGSVNWESRQVPGRG